jgi:hypothetical protein
MVAICHPDSAGGARRRQTPTRSARANYLQTRLSVPDQTGGCKQNRVKEPRTINPPATGRGQCSHGESLLRLLGIRRGGIAQLRGVGARTHHRRVAQSRAFSRPSSAAQKETLTNVHYLCYNATTRHHSVRSLTSRNKSDHSALVGIEYSGRLKSLQVRAHQQARIHGSDCALSVRYWRVNSP